MHLRLNGVFIEHLGWDRCVEKYDRARTLFFMDPPYWGTEGYGVAFGLEQYDLMAQHLRKMAGRAIVTVNDVPEMRAAFAGFTMERVSITYTVGDAKRRQPTGELIIRNW